MYWEIRKVTACNRRHGTTSHVRAAVAASRLSSSSGWCSSASTASAGVRVPTPAYTASRRASSVAGDSSAAELAFASAARCVPATTASACSAASLGPARTHHDSGLIHTLPTNALRP